MSKKQFILSSKGQIADLNKGISRKDMYISRTSGVPTDDYKAIKYGIERILGEIDSRIKTRDFDYFEVGNGPYSSPDKYQERAMLKRDRGYGSQASAPRIDGDLRKEPWQVAPYGKPHYDFMVVDRDLTTAPEENNNFVFGIQSYPNNIISVRRFDDCIKNDEIREMSLAIIAAHEVTHNIPDLVIRNFNIGTEGYKIDHCNGENGPCLMEQVNVPYARNIDEQAMLIFDRDNWLCQDCQDEANAKKDVLERRGIYW